MLRYMARSKPHWNGSYRVSSMSFEWQSHHLLGIQQTASLNTIHVDDVKPYSSIPGPKGLPFIGSAIQALKSGALQNKLHKYFIQLYKEYGPIFKAKLGDYESVFIHDPNDIEMFFRKEGRYPRRTEFPAWSMHRQQSGHAYGIALR